MFAAALRIFAEVWYGVPPACEAWAEADPYGWAHLTDWAATPPTCLVDVPDGWECDALTGARGPWGGTDA